ncbi:MAG: protein kinase [Myxococcota bacterium]|jgi:serine/threonine-protein kinase|nr:protein kinase [Myxococcota bacterium]
MQSTTGPSATLPEHLGRYTVLARLGAGGMAEVLLGYLEGAAGFGRYVAIKRLLPHFAGDSEVATMFVDEGRVLARIRHPNVVAVEDLVDDGQNVFLVLEHLVGESLAGFLSELAKRGLELTPDLAAYVVAEAAAGLHAAHTTVDDDGNPLKLVHRDVSPQNLFVTVQGDVKVLDFGIARHEDRLAVTRERGLRGKLAYMSPEQLAARPFDHRADVFALGTVLFEALTARRLFRRDSDVETIRAVCVEPIPDPRVFVPSLPAVFAEICTRALARDPDRRFRSALEMREALLVASLVDSNAPRDELAKLSKRAFGDALEERARRHRETKRRLESSAPPGSTDRDVVLPPPARVPSFAGTRSSVAPVPSVDPVGRMASRPSGGEGASSFGPLFGTADTVDESSSTPLAHDLPGSTPSSIAPAPSSMAPRIPSSAPSASSSPSSPAPSTSSATSWVAKVAVVLGVVALSVAAAWSIDEDGPDTPVLQESALREPRSTVVVEPEGAVERGVEPVVSVPATVAEPAREPTTATQTTTPTATTTDTTTTDATTTDATTTDATTAEAETVSLTLESAPSGARVAVDGAWVGVTPTTITLPRADTPRALTFARDAHHDRVMHVVPDRSSRVHAVLRRRAPRDEDEPPIAGAGIDLDYP